MSNRTLRWRLGAALIAAPLAATLAAWGSSSNASSTDGAEPESPAPGGATTLEKVAVE